MLGGEGSFREYWRYASSVEEGYQEGGYAWGGYGGEGEGG